MHRRTRSLALKKIPTTATAVLKIKDRARHLRDQHSSLGHARDAAAKEAGYDDYHHVTICAKESQASPKSFEGVDFVRSALHVLPALIEADPMYTKSLKQAHYDLNHSFGIDFLDDRLKTIHRQGGNEYFRAACSDYFEHLKISGFTVTADAAVLSKDLSLVYQTWEALLDPKHQDLHRTLLNHSYVKVLAGHLSGIEGSPSAIHKETSHSLILTLQALAHCSNQEQLSEFGANVASGLLPRNMNISIHTGAEDYSEPSTYWSRISSSISVEMAGFFGTFPIARIKAAAADIELIGLDPTVVPIEDSRRKDYIERSRQRAASVCIPAP